MIGDNEMNTFIRAKFKCTFDVFLSKMMEIETECSQFLEIYQIAKVDERNSIIVRKILDFVARESFMATDDIKAWGAEHGCVDTVYIMDTAQ